MYNGRIDVKGLLALAEEQRRRLAEFEERRADFRVSCWGPKELVEVVLDASMVVVEVNITSRAMRLDNIDLADEILGALTSAYSRWQEQMAESMSSIADQDILRRELGGQVDPAEWFRQFGVDLPNPASGRHG